MVVLVVCCHADEHAEEEHVTGWRRLLLHLNSTTALTEPLQISSHDAHSRTLLDNFGHAFQAVLPVWKTTLGYLPAACGPLLCGQLPLRGWWVQPRPWSEVWLIYNTPYIERSECHGRPSTASPCKWPLRARNPGICIFQAYLAVKLAGPLSATRNLSFALWCVHSLLGISDCNFCRYAQ